MSADRSINRRIGNELDEIIQEVSNKTTLILRKMGILSPNDKVGYISASRMVALKLKKYEIPFNDNVINELIKIAKENGGSA